MSKDPVVDAIVATRVRLLFNAPFFGNLATRLQLVDASKWCPTAAVDGRHLFYNREFIKALTPEELLFLIGHEVLHCVYDHLGRKGSRDHKLWNFANDYIVNATLVDQKMGSMPKGGLLDSRFTSEMTSEEVYRMIEEDVKSGKMDASKMSTLDQHLALDGSDEGADGTDPQSGPGGRNPNGDPDPGSETGVDYSKAPPVYKDEDMAKIRNEVKAALINAVQSNVGNIPAGVLRMVEEMTDPTINWRDLLTECIQSTFKEDYSFQQPSKRSWSIAMGAKDFGGRPIILPSQKQGKTIDICISLDTSGSISNSIFTQFLTEVVGIVEQYEDFKLHVWCIDAAIYNPMTFTPDNIQDLMDYQPAGGGGNDFPLNWTYMQENDLEPEMFVVFSDGYPCGSWGDPNYCPTIFVIRNEWDKKIEAPFGLTVYMDD
jgi:predicted metal-dependent peptidase